MNDKLDVHVEIGSEMLRAGTAYFHRRRGRLSTDFTYDQEYLANSISDAEFARFTPLFEGLS